jgi:hypothetical protein
MTDKTNFTGKIDFHEKTARPANVGPHDVNEDQHDPDAPKRKPEDMYKTEVEGQAAIVGPKTSGKAPVHIRVKGAAGDAPGQPDETAAPDAGVTEETKRKTTGRGKADAAGVPKA